MGAHNLKPCQQQAQRGGGEDCQPLRGFVGPGYVVGGLGCDGRFQDVPYFREPDLQQMKKLNHQKIHFHELKMDRSTVQKKVK